MFKYDYKQLGAEHYESTFQQAMRKFQDGIEKLREEHALKAIVDGWPWQACRWVSPPPSSGTRWDLWCGATWLASVVVDWTLERGPVVKAGWVGPQLKPDHVIEA